MTALRHSALGAGALAAIAVALFAADFAYANQGFNLGLPLPGVRPRSGLSMTFDCTWPDGSGYLPVRITVAGNSPNERRLSVEISSRYFGERRPVMVTDRIDLPAGPSQTTKVIPFPRFSNNLILSFDVWENGRYLSDLSFDNRPFRTTFVGGNLAPKTLFVTDKQVDVSALGLVTNTQAYGYTVALNATPAASPPASGTATAISPAQVESFASLSPNDLFDGWLNYSGLDVIFIALSDLEKVAGSRPKVIEALADWTRAGGNLCVYETGDKWSQLPKLESLLQMELPESDADKPDRGWSRPDPAIYNTALQQPGGAIVVTDDADVDDGSGTTKARRRKRTPPTATFLHRELGLGMVLALSQANPFPGKTDHWRWLFNTIGPARWQWEFRNGVAVNDGNESFDDFTIADAGLPPVKAYRVLITLFVVAIGPVNYWLLYRKGRLHLLLFTVPVAAILVSLSLVAYAVIADGFDAYLRARSFTQLDQTHDRAVTWARLSYYAGMTPSEGLLFTRQTALYPVFRDSSYTGSVQAERATEWTSEQRLVRGWVPSRTPTQYATVHPHTSQRELRVVETTEPAGCTVENRLGAKIRFLMLRSANGDLYYGQDLAPDGRLALEDINDEAKAEARASEMLKRRSALAPNAMTVSATPASRLFFGPARRQTMRMGNSYSVYGSSLMDAELAIAFEEIGARLPDKNTYIAIVERPPDVEVGMSDLIDRQSLHVIRGTW